MYPCACLQIIYDSLGKLEIGIHLEATKPKASTTFIFVLFLFFILFIFFFFFIYFIFWLYLHTRRESFDVGGVNVMACW